MSFRIKQIHISNSTLSTEDIDLIDTDEDVRNNHFTVLIGNNGTGKSRILASIARRYQKNKDGLNFDFSASNNPKRVFAITNSITDKFPLDDTFRWKRSNVNSYSKLKYVYLGARNKINSFSPRTLISKAIDILLESFSTKKGAREIRYIFDYLSFEPIIKISYSFSFKLKVKVQINTKQFLSIIEENSSKNNFYSEFNSSFRRNYEEFIPELIDFINQENLNNEDNDLVINFSKSNISRISGDRKIYTDTIKHYRYLDILRKLNLVRSYDIKIYKKGGNEFNFNNASSGESAILSSLIGFVPLIKNDSLVLIDEPELSLHPSWQYRYIELLQKLTKHVNGCHIIIATHSHYIVSDLPIENSTVVILNNDKGKITGKTLQGTTYGQAAEDVILNIFGLPTTRNYYLSQLLTDALRLIGLKEEKNEEFVKIKKQILKLRSNMRESDPLKKVVDLIIEKS